MIKNLYVVYRYLLQLFLRIIVFSSATSSEAKRFKACETSSDDGDVGKEPNWLEADLSSPIKSFKRISELEETCMDFKNQFKVRDKVSSKGQWKSFRKGRKGKRRK